MKKNNSKKMGKVSIVVSIDTEGPIVNKEKPEIISSWLKIKKLIKQITKKKFRENLKDSRNQGLVYSWFILTLTGFKTNPFKRPMKYHETLDFYLKNFKNNFFKNNDGVYWHYHQPASSGIGNEWTRDWFSSNEYINIINRLIVERNFFPNCFRAGGRIEDNNLSHWLEEFFPFDFSNCSGNINWNRIESDGKKLSDVADWSKASKKWDGYNPSFQDYQKKGKMKRYIFRSVDLKSPVYKLTENDIHEAFDMAANGTNSLLSVFEHDRRFSLIDNLEEFLVKIKKVSKDYKNVKFFFSNAQEGALRTIGKKQKKEPNFFFKSMKENRIMIQSDSEIFGSRPYVCLQNKKKIIEIPVSKIGVNTWLTPPIQNILNKKLFVVANNETGNNRIFKYFKKNK